MRPSLLQALGGVSISRRCAADICADALDASRKDGDSLGDSMAAAYEVHASGCWHIVSARCTASALLARVQQLPPQRKQQQATQVSGEEHSRARLPCLRRFADFAQIDHWQS